MYYGPRFYVNEEINFNYEIFSIIDLMYYYPYNTIILSGFEGIKNCTHDYEFTTWDPFWYDPAPNVEKQCMCDDININWMNNF